MINLIDDTGWLSLAEFHRLKNFIVDHCLCTYVETPWLLNVRVRRDGMTGYYGYWSVAFDQIGLDIRNVQAVIVLNASYLLTMQQLERTLAHEFGHHWTIGYMLERLEMPFTERTPREYYRMRGMTEQQYAPDYSLGWDHCDKEVLAEDYKYLFSPYTGQHRMEKELGNPSAEVMVRIWDLGFARRRSWEDQLRSRFGM